MNWPTSYTESTVRFYVNFSVKRSLGLVSDIKHRSVSLVLVSDVNVLFACWVSGVARICYEEGQRWKLCHGALTVDFRAGCSSCSMTNSFVTNAVGLY